jgi:hypothetical protein
LTFLHPILMSRIAYWGASLEELRASSPATSNRHIYIKISWCLMLSVLIHKH